MRDPIRQVRDKLVAALYDCAIEHGTSLNDDIVTDFEPHLEAALLHAQQVQREQDAQLCDDEAVRMTKMECHAQAAGALYCEEAIKQQASPPDYGLATLRSQEIL